MSTLSEQLIGFNIGKSEEWQSLLVTYAEKYADKVKADYKQFIKEYKRGLFKPNLKTFKR